MALSFNSKRDVKGAAPPPRRGPTGKAKALRLALGVMVGLSWILALEWLFGSMLAAAADG